MDHISTGYILSKTRLVGFVTIELYPIHGVPSRLGPHQILRGIVLPIELFRNLVQHFAIQVILQFEYLEFFQLLSAEGLLQLLLVYIHKNVESAICSLIER